MAHFNHELLLTLTYYEKLTEVKKQRNYLSLWFTLVYNIQVLYTIYLSNQCFARICDQWAKSKKLVKLFYKWKIHLKETEEGKVALMVHF